MQHSPMRRSLILAMLATPVVSACAPLLSNKHNKAELTAHKQLAALEQSAGGRLGLSLINASNHHHINYRADERFAVCSTFKVILAAAILKQSMLDPQLLTQQIRYNADDVVSSGYAPITQKHQADGMSVVDLCAATIQYSDNTAANLLMKILGGPQALTAYAQSLGDHFFRLDRWEPQLNTAIPNDVRDTSTPLAMAKTLNTLVLGDALGLSQRAQLATWLQGNTTGDKRIRAATPKGWRVGDKTGTGSYGTTNDVAVIWLSQGEPLILTVYFTQAEKSAAPRDDVIASATQIILDALH